MRCRVATGGGGVPDERSRASVSTCCERVERESATVTTASPIVRLHSTQLYSGRWATGLPATPIRHPTGNEFTRVRPDAAVSWNPATIDRKRAADLQRDEVATAKRGARRRPSQDRPCGQSRRGPRIRECFSRPPTTGRSPCRRQWRHRRRGRARLPRRPCRG